MPTTLIKHLWGPEAKFKSLFFASILMLFLFLGARDLWTQEHRWADIVFGMFFRHDFLHPYLGQNFYYDKPLLSYWLIALFAKLSGSLTTWVLRLPTTLFGLITIFSIYWLGSNLKDKALGLLSGWLLITTLYFIFWSRVSTTDILNVGGTTFAIAWYMAKREKARFGDYSVFFLILGITSLFKGLVGAIIPVIAVLIDLSLRQSWRQHLNWKMAISIIPGAIVYFLPFWASSHFTTPGYGENGLYLVYQENFLRYFKPFDHRGPLYTYFVALPVLLLPWTCFFIPALISSPWRWRTMSINSKWITLTFTAIFLFFTLSGSRRSYYILPAMPFAILLTADWILAGGLKKQTYTALLVVVSFIAVLFAVDLFPAWFYRHYGVAPFAQQLLADIPASVSLSNQNVILLDAESKIGFYLSLPPNMKYYSVHGNRDAQTQASLLKAWPFLQNKPTNTIFITRRSYLPMLQQYFVGYRVVAMTQPPKLPFVKQADLNSLVAFIPNTSIL